MAKRPVIIERRLFSGLETSTISTCTTTNSTIRLADRKWKVRADCRPPNSSGSHGQSAFMLGDIERPVSTIIGNRTKITAR